MSSLKVAFKQAAAGLSLLALTGCGTGLNNRVVGGCTVHEAVGLFSGVSWADCPVRPGHVVVAGNSMGVVPAVGPIIGGAATGAGTAVAGKFIQSGIQNAVKGLGSGPIPIP